MFFKKQLLSKYYLIFFYFLKKKIGGINKSKINIYIFLKMNYILLFKTLVNKILHYKKYIFYFLLKKNIYIFFTNFYNFFKKKLIKKSKIYYFSKYSEIEKSNSIFHMKNLSTVTTNSYNNIYSINYYLNFLLISYNTKFLYNYYINHMFNEKVSSIPGRRKRYTVLRSPFKYKKSREQFELSYIKMCIKNSTIFSIIDSDFFASYLSNLLDSFKLEEVSKSLIH
jgi:hypothetical protein